MTAQDLQKTDKNEVYSSIRPRRTRRVKLARRDTLGEERRVVYSHIYNKGVENRNLFIDEEDYEMFLGYLEDYLTAAPDRGKIKKSFTVNGRTFQGVPHQPKNYFNKVELIAYSLMSDHFHLLVNQKTEGSLEKLIRSLSTRYAIYYNNKYQRRGSLFIGPYKSVQIDNASHLLHLTRYFHHENLLLSKSLKENGYSSYEEYLGQRVTSWVNPKVVLSYFEKGDIVFFKGKDGYKNFVESYVLKPEEREILSKIVIEDRSKHLGASILEPKKEGSPKEVATELGTEPRPRIPEFLATSLLVFVLLFTLGIRNINNSQAQSKSSITAMPSPTPQVSGLEDVQPKPPRAGGSQEPEAKILVIKISDGSESINIRRQPSTKSDKVGEAKEGDAFEFVSEEGGWYQIKLDDGSLGFISTRYTEIMEGENQSR